MARRTLRAIENPRPASRLGLRAGKRRLLGGRPTIGLRLRRGFLGRRFVVAPLLLHHFRPNFAAFAEEPPVDNLE